MQQVAQNRTLTMTTKAIALKTLTATACTVRTDSHSSGRTIGGTAIRN